MCVCVCVFVKNLILGALKRIGNIIPKRLWNKEIKKPCLKFNLRLSLIGLKSSLPS